VDPPLRRVSRQAPSGRDGREITQFLTDLAVRGKVAASTQNQALSALLFLYREVLGQDIPSLEGVVRAKRARRLPVVLTRDETRAVLDRLRGVPGLMALVLYGAGLRVLECARLRCSAPYFMRQISLGHTGRGRSETRSAI
jgi:integrase